MVMFTGSDSALVRLTFGHSCTIGMSSGDDIRRESLRPTAKLGNNNSQPHQS